MKREDLNKALIVLLLVCIAYLPVFIWMLGRWGAKDSYYSHGYLVPFISAFLIWLKREKLGKMEINPSARAGWVLLSSGIAIHLISAVLRVYFSSGFSLILVLSGIVLLFLGKEFLKNILFPILFLVFMMPLPLVAIANISFKLKIFAAQISTIVINWMGVAAAREGSIIKTAHSYVVVEDPCSGIRSLIALIALGALMAYFSRLSMPKRIILFLSAIPIAVFSNVIRIVALSLVSDMYGAKLAGGTFHTVMGLLVFVFSFLGLLLIEKVME